MKYILYEIKGEYDVVLKLTFLKYAWLNNYIKMHTEENKYIPVFIVYELDANDEIDYISKYNGVEQLYRKCLAEYID
jgi:hypothetical protein